MGQGGQISCVRKQLLIKTRHLVVHSRLDSCNCTVQCLAYILGCARRAGGVRTCKRFRPNLSAFECQEYMTNVNEQEPHPQISVSGLILLSKQTTQANR